jgi:TetR/AcrR family transcriptional regulator, mexJK operon transcriptional repressor
MDAVEVRKLTADERRHHILDIAYEAFRRDGYSGTSMSHIAALLGGSKTTLYNYFSTKKELFVAVVDRESAKLFDQIFAVGESAGDFRATVIAFAQRLLSAMLADDIIAAQRMIVAESGRFPEVGYTAYETALQSGMRRLSERFARAIAAGDMRAADPKLAAEQLLDLTCGNLYRQRLWNVIADVGEETITAEALRIANTFLAAFGNDALSKDARDASVN